MAIIGPSNSGITTTLRSLNRLFELNPDARLEGEILIDNQSIITEGTSVTELRRRVGMVFANPRDQRTHDYVTGRFGKNQLCAKLLSMMAWRNKLL